MYVLPRALVAQKRLNLPLKPLSLLNDLLMLQSLCQVAGHILGNKEGSEAVCNAHPSGKIKLIAINILGGTVSGTNRNLPRDKWDPFLGQTWTRP